MRTYTRYLRLFTSLAIVCIAFNIVCHDFGEEREPYKFVEVKHASHLVTQVELKDLLP